jgi:hypothetical protein
MFAAQIIYNARHETTWFINRQISFNALIDQSTQHAWIVIRDLLNANIQSDLSVCIDHNAAGALLLGDAV